MSWLNRLFGKKTAPLEPWSFPHRIDGLADSLALTVFEHEMAALGRSIPCWTFVSDGLLGHGQKELVLTVARARGEHPQGFAHEVAGFVTAVHRVAGQGQLVDVGELTLFGGLGPGGAQGVAYIHPEPLPGVEIPLSSLAVIPLMGAEAQLARDFGLARVMARLAAHYRFYPCPVWWERGRTAIAAVLGDDTSLLAQMPRVHIRGVSARMEGSTVRLSVHPAAREGLQRTLAAAPRDVAFALMIEPDVEADGMFVWRPGEDALSAATPEGSRGERLSLAFVGFAVGVDDVGGRVMEDGAMLMLTAEAWQALCAALDAGEPFTVPPTVGNVGLQLHWMADRYVSSVDGRAYGVGAGWRTYHPSSATPSSSRPRVLDRIALLTSEEHMAGRVTAEALSAYMDGLEREFVQQCGAGPERVEIFIRVELRPGQPARVVGQGDLDETRIAELIARVAPPAITGGSVAFECRLTTPPDPN